MSFKVHLFIVSLIIIAVSLIWQLRGQGTPTPQEAAVIPHVISIIHASWGMNCKDIAIVQDGMPQDAFGNPQTVNPKIKLDNVFGPVSMECNGKTECEIQADDAKLGEDPAPECTPKTLEIEYRCFSYDRPWRVKASSGPLKLKCETPGKDVSPKS
jgi:hypothetical protein